MARRPKPWYRKSRKALYVTIDGVRHKIGSTKAEADQNFKLLMQQPKKKRIAIQQPMAEISIRSSNGRTSTALKRPTSGTAAEAEARVCSKDDCDRIRSRRLG